MSSPAVMISATEMIRQSPLPSLRSLEVIENDSEVTLSVCVSSYYEKQLAQETVRPVLGERRLLNMVRVKRS